VKARRAYDYLRRWRYRESPEVAENLRVMEYFQLSQDFFQQSGLRPLLVSPEGLFIKTELGFFLKFDPSRFSSKLWGVEKTGRWEEETVSYCCNEMRQGGTFFDIGANVGFYSLSVASVVPGCYVHAFEPVKENLELLEANVRTSGLQNRITVNNFGFGEFATDISMVVKGQLSHVVPSATSTELGIDTVHIETVDRYCVQHGISDVRLVKCDVEGFELFVLRGAAHTLASQKPKLLLEIEDRWTKRYNYTPDDIMIFLGRFGYSHKPLIRDPLDRDSDVASMHLFEVV